MTDTITLLALPHEQELTFSFERYLPKNDNVEDDPNDKREICKYFAKGSCFHGANCQYKHIKKNKHEKSVVCKHWLRSLCKKGDNCEFLHQFDKRKMPECTFFQSYGRCSNIECLFRHVRPEDRIKPCENYEMGFCPKGPDCPKKHIRKVACPDYIAGFCIKGPKCKFAHPRWDQKLLQRQDAPKKVFENVVCFKCGEKGHYAGSEDCPLRTNDNYMRYA